MREVLIGVGCCVGGVGLGMLLAWLLVPLNRTVSDRSMRRHGWERCPFCKGPGCIRITGGAGPNPFGAPTTEGEPT